MSAAASDDGETRARPPLSRTDRARLFPLPQWIIGPSSIPAASSARVRARLRQRRFVLTATNRCVAALNLMYSTSAESASASVSAPAMAASSHTPASISVPFPSKQPDKRSSAVLPHHRTCAHTVPPSCAAPSLNGLSASASRAQQRLLLYLHQQCTAFVSSVRAAGASSPAGSATVASVLSELDTVEFNSSSAGAALSLHMPPATPSASFAPDQEPDSPVGIHGPAGSPVEGAPFYASHTTAVPILAHRIGLPEQLQAVPLLRVLPPAVAAQYATAASGASLFRPIDQVALLDSEHPLSPPRIAGTRPEYVELIGRMHALGMVAFTTTPRCINGVFAVEKDTDSDRLIIDARPANRLFIDSPTVHLCDPSYLVQLCVPQGTRMVTGKSDLSNFYHHLQLPSWLRDYFALLPLTDEELSSLGLEAQRVGGHYPCCTTLPMGFSHAVYLAQQAHLHVLSTCPALRPGDHIIHLSSPVLSSDRVVYGVVIDDFFLFGTDVGLTTRVFEQVLSAYADAGFVVKPSKVVRPTLKAVKVIGFDIGGPTSEVCLPGDSMLALLRDTLAVLRRGAITGLAMASLIGRWTWTLLLRRPSLAVLQRVYRFIEMADRRRFDLWPSVRSELQQLLALAPLLRVKLDAGIHSRVIATDASTLAAGVVTSSLADLEPHAWPVCSSRVHATRQPLVLSSVWRTGTWDTDMLGPDTLSSPISDAGPALADINTELYDRFYSSVCGARWSRVMSVPWQWTDDHINALELRAALLSVHWLLSFPSSMGKRAYLLTDSTVTLFGLWKGRSSSPSLLLVLRKISALLLSSGVALLVGWIPSEINPADTASRLRSDSGPKGGRQPSPWPPPPRQE